MDKKIEALLQNGGGNYLLPFFWQHGEDEETLRQYMGVIQTSGCDAVCVESRPHPDYCGSGWWKDMDVILDEAKKRNMKVWILDDSHFPTGNANGALLDAPKELCRQSIYGSGTETCEDEKSVEMDVMALILPKIQELPPEAMTSLHLPEKLRRFDDDRLLDVTAVCKETGETVNLTNQVEAGRLYWKKPQGIYTIWATGLTRNAGVRRHYINMLDADSCRIQIEAVYEPHWKHYREYFGTTIAGFFSDEPELGNGALFQFDNPMGSDQDYPFGGEMPGLLEASLGAEWAREMYLLWDNDGDRVRKARVRFAYMDAVTKLVRKNFSRQMGKWCQEHGVEYIGHSIEDNGAHTRTGSGLGHYFRGLAGQHMAGIDDIGGQVLPQGEDDSIDAVGRIRKGSFYQFTLAKLAASAAAVEPGKKGRAVCEIFGNYGWGAGVHLEKYLIDHFLVRGINHFVPHAFTPKAFPDPDCPPHFYAQGHNPQYRHFGKLMRYTNRMCELLGGGRRISQVALLYHAEAEWTGKYMSIDEPARRLTEAQIDFDILPADVFCEPEAYHTVLGDRLQVNGQEYKAFVIPMAEFLPCEVIDAAGMLKKEGFPVIFLESLPTGTCNGDVRGVGMLADCQVVKLDELVPILRKGGASDAVLVPEESYMRILHYRGEHDIYFFVNEGKKTWEGFCSVPQKGCCYGYDAMENCLEEVEAVPADNGMQLHLRVEPLKSVAVVFDQTNLPLRPGNALQGKTEELSNWDRTLAENAPYEIFTGHQNVLLPDHLEEEMSEFSGVARYETEFQWDGHCRMWVEIQDAAEGIEVFLNDHSIGLRLIPPYQYELNQWLVPGRNRIVIEVSTTLERKCYGMISSPIMKQFTKPPVSRSGITGKVLLYREDEER